MQTLADLSGTTWSGTGELWLDPLSNEAACCDCTITLEASLLQYTWSYNDKKHMGRIALEPKSANFTDSFHSTEVMKCEVLKHTWGLFQVQGTYGPNSDWGWRIGLSHRAESDELVLQMTNIAPWGEETRAVRMIGKR